MSYFQVNLSSQLYLHICTRLSMSRCSENSSGITKRRLTGNQRKKLRAEQAAKLGISASELLQQRRSRMEEWQRVKSVLSRSRCPNCGIWGHSFTWCPFADDFRMKCARFRGPNGVWGSEHSPELTPQQHLRYNQYFSLLCMPLRSETMNTNLQCEQAINDRVLSV